MLASALFYACTTVRLGLYANRFPAVQLAAAKTVVLCLISFVWLAGEVAEGAAPTAFDECLCLRPKKRACCLGRKAKRRGPEGGQSAASEER